MSLTAGEEEDAATNAQSSRYLKAPVPSDTDIAKGTIWDDIVFDAHIDHIIKTDFPLTNHRLLSKKRVKEVFHILKNWEKGTRLIELVFCPVRYIVYSKNADGTTVKDEIALPDGGTARAFVSVFSRLSVRT